MGSNELINYIDDFFKTADENALAEVNKAFSVEIDGDITIEEYFSGFSDEYFYTHDYESNRYVSGTFQLQTNDKQYVEMGFDGSLAEYGKTYLNIPLDLESKNLGEVTKMIKKAA